MNSGSPGQQVWKRFRNNKTAMSGLILISLSVFISVFCYMIIPDHTPLVNRMCLPVGNQPPGFSVKMVRVKKVNSNMLENGFDKFFNGEPDSYKEIAVNRVWVEGSKVLYDEYSDDNTEAPLTNQIPLPVAMYPLKTDTSFVNTGEDFLITDNTGHSTRISTTELKEKFFQTQVFSRTYWLGTDRYGRDLLSRLLAGTRVTMSVGLVAVIISLILGCFLGSLAGFFKGRMDQFVLWLINVTWSIPTLLLVIAITLVLGKGFEQVFIAVGLTMWVDVARLVRSQLFAVRELEFISAGQAMGFRSTRIILRHMLPNILGPVLVIAASNFSTAILLESGLSFLGIGAQPPTPSWGTMIKENYGYIIIPGSAYLAVLPGIAIMLLTMSFTFVANGLRDAMDSRQQVVFS